MRLLIYLMVVIAFQIFKIILNLLLKNMKLLQADENSPVLIYPNKIKNTLVFKI